MKGKGSRKTFYSIFFLASIFFASYILLEYRESYFAVGATGAILLIAGYLFMDCIEKEKKEEIVSKQEEINSFLKKLDDLEYIEKRIYALLKKDANLPEEALEEAGMPLENFSTQDFLAKQLQKIADAQNQAMENARKAAEAQVSAAKTVAKYNRENTRQLALNADENTERITECLKALLEEWKQGGRNYL